MYRTECTMFDEVYMGNPGKVPHCNERDQFEPDCANCERPNVTNADRIRRMSDEELAEFLGENDSNFPIGDHKKKWLDWLKQEDG